MSYPKVDALGEPVWELAYLFPNQGNWSEIEYLALNTNHLVELSHGCLIFPPMPDLRHQGIVGHLLTALYNHCEERGGGDVLPAPLPLKLGPGEYREPDLLYMTAEQSAAIVGDYPDRAEIVMEVVMGEAKDRDRDYLDKRRDYALAGIPEYWIVDPQEEVIIVLRLEGKEYTEHGRFVAGDVPTSALLLGFSVVVGDVWDAAK
jgi:Uma2 family endonuclease